MIRASRREQTDVDKGDEKLTNRSAVRILREVEISEATVSWMREWAKV